MLHLLKNDAIYPFFWKLRKKSVCQRVRFLDLEKLKLFLLAQTDQDPEQDMTLEKNLYGDAVQPFYSGWTPKRVYQIAKKSGFKCVPVDSKNSTSFFSEVQLEETKWRMVDRIHCKKDRLSQKVWNFRKNLRKSFYEIVSKSQGLFSKKRFPRNNLWLNLGAGEENHGRYIKVDMTGKQDVYDDIVTLSKFAVSSVEQIYCNHVLEHLPKDAVEKALKRWFEILCPGGMVFARMPNAKECIKYLRENWVEASPDELKKFGLPNYLAKESSLTGWLDDNACIQCVYGWSDSSPHYWDLTNQHKTLWTPELAKMRFTDAGFTVERASSFGDLNTLVICRKL